MFCGGYFCLLAKTSKNNRLKPIITTYITGNDILVFVYAVVDAVVVARLFVKFTQCSVLIQPRIYAPGTHYNWVTTTSMECKVCHKFQLTTGKGLNNSFLVWHSIPSTMYFYVIFYMHWLHSLWIIMHILIVTCFTLKRGVTWHIVLSHCDCVCCSLFHSANMPIVHYASPPILNGMWYIVLNWKSYS